MKLKTYVLASIAACFSASAALAVEDFVKPAPTPPPTAGPTLSAANEFCGEPTGKADDLITKYSAQNNLKQTYKSADYVAYSDDEKNPTLVYTMTVKGHPAYPAIVCRKQEKDGENILLKMVVVCDGGKDSCDKLRNDFNVMNAKMQVDIDQQIAAAKK